MSMKNRQMINVCIFLGSNIQVCLKSGLTLETHRVELCGCGVSESHQWFRWSECCCWPEPD